MPKSFLTDTTPSPEPNREEVAGGPPSDLMGDGGVYEAWDACKWSPKEIPLQRCGQLSETVATTTPSPEAISHGFTGKGTEEMELVSVSCAATQENNVQQNALECDDSLDWMSLLQCDDVVDDVDVSHMGILRGDVSMDSIEDRLIQWYGEPAVPVEVLCESEDSNPLAETVEWRGPVLHRPTMLELGTALGYSEPTIVGADKCFNTIVPLLGLEGHQTTIQLQEKAVIVHACEAKCMCLHLVAKVTEQEEQPLETVLNALSQGGAQWDVELANEVMTHMLEKLDFHLLQDVLADASLEQADLYATTFLSFFPAGTNEHDQLGKKW